MVVSGLIVRPGAYFSIKPARSVPGFDTGCPTPCSIALAISARRSLLVVFVRGNSAPVQTETERIF